MSNPNPGSGRKFSFDITTTLIIIASLQNIEQIKRVLWRSKVATMRVGFISIFFVLSVFRGAVVAETFLRGKEDFVDTQGTVPSIYDCLQAASGEDECKTTWGGQCVWCAEPVFGLCVTPTVANRIGKLPFFSCDQNVNVEAETA